MTRLCWLLLLLSSCLAGACEGTESGNPSDLLDGGAPHHGDASAGHGGMGGKGGSGGTGGTAGSGGTGEADASTPRDAGMDAGGDQDAGDEDAGGATR